MTIVRHYPETSPPPTESSFPGYPLGVWPPIISSFCRENATYETRHGDCSLPGCTCPCHSRPRTMGNLERETRTSTALAGKVLFFVPVPNLLERHLDQPNVTIGKGKS